MSRSGWNSHFPSRTGLEFIGIGSRQYPITQQTDHVAVRFKAQRTGNIDSVAVYMGPKTYIGDGLPGVNLSVPYIVEIMTLANYAVTGVPQLARYPSTTFTNDGTISQSGSPGGGTELAVQADGLYLIPPFIDSTVDVAFNGASAFPSSGVHVLSVGFEVLTTRQVFVWRLGDYNVLGVKKWRKTIGGLTTLSTGWMGEAWAEQPTVKWSEVTPTMVRQFATSIGNRRCQMAPITSLFQTWDYLNLVVKYQAERRLGVGILTPPNISSGGSVLQQGVWVDVPMHVPAVTGSVPSVTTGTDYVLVIRPAYNSSDYKSAYLDLRAVGDQSVIGAPGYAHFNDLDWDNDPATLWDTPACPRALTSPPKDGIFAVRTKVAGAQTDDSQPYEQMLGAEVGSGRDARQIALPANTSAKYGLLSCVVSADKDPADSLFAAVRRNDNNALIGTASIALTDMSTLPSAGVDDLGNEYKRALLDVGSLTLPSLVDVVFSSTSPTGNPWLVAALGARTTSPGGTGNVTFGGSSSFATGSAVDPLSDTLVTLATYGTADLEVTLNIKPAAVTGSVAVAQQAIPGGTCVVCTHSSACTVTGIGYAVVSWTSSPATGFAYYEVQRMDLVPSYRTVAKITNVGILSYADYELPYGVSTHWRIRVVETDGSFSDWSNAVSLTLPPPPGADMIITAPTNPIYNVAFPENHGAQLPTASDYSFLDAADTVFVPIYGEDNQLAFRPTEMRGMQFSRQLILAALCANNPPCLANATATLRGISIAPEPYLVVRDNCGGRWFAAVAFATATYLADPGIHNGGIWLGDVQVTELVTPEPQVISA